MKTAKKINTVIESDKGVLRGTPVFRGSRVPVALILEYLAKGWSIDDLKTMYPTVKSEYISSVLLHYSGVLNSVHGQAA